MVISFEYSPWFAILKKHSRLIKEICELEKDKILQGEKANFEKIHSEMLRTAYFIQTIENIIKQTPWEVKLKIRNTFQIINEVFGH
jgi:hypothetical protein